MMRNILFIITLFIYTLTYAQGEINAFQFSQNDLTGSARGISMGGAMGAIGADITGVASNPAGIALYRSSELTATMSLGFNSIQTDLNGSKNKKNNFIAEFDNAAYMFYNPLGSEKIKCFNYGIAYNRIKNFNQKYKSTGNQLSSSLTDYIATTTYGIPVNYLEYNGTYSPAWNSVPWLSILSYQDYLIDLSYIDESGKSVYESQALEKNDLINNELMVEESGHIDSYDFSGGINISDFLYLGATISFVDLKYDLTSSYYEYFPKNKGQFNLFNSRHTEGSGIQTTIGIIARPINILRIGLAYHSPTWYNLEDSYYADMDAAASPDGYMQYKFRTPSRWTFSSAATIKNKAIISLDYELTNYKEMNMKYETMDSNFDGLENTNEYINEDFKLAGTLKAGIEFVILPKSAIRAGFTWMQSPLEPLFKNGEQSVQISEAIPNYTLAGDITQYSLGYSYRINQNFYVDLALIYKTQTDNLYTFPKLYNYGTSTGENPDLVVDSTPANFTKNQFKGLLTLRFKL